MPTFLLILPITAILTFFYHYERNGNPLNLGQFASRCFWSSSFAFCAFLLRHNPIIASICFVTAYLEILIPHAFAQNMGTLDRPWTIGPKGQALGAWKWWPGGWLPFPETQKEWNSCPGFFKTLLDFLGMMTTGLIRGLIVFAPLYALNCYFGIGIDLVHMMRAVAVTMFGQPMDYLIGRFFPLSLFGNQRDSAAWGEFFVGPSWSASLFAAFV